MPLSDESLLAQAGKLVKVNAQGTDFIFVDPVTSGGVAWGAITGTLSAQTDLNTALGTKANSTHSHAPLDITGTAVITNDVRLTDARAPLHTIKRSSTITNLQTTLDGKEAANLNIQAHVISAHAPATAQKNSDITQPEIEAKLTGAITTHTHAGGADPFIAKLVLAADKPTGANTTPVTTGLVFSFEANSKYVIDIFAMVQPAAATTGCGFALDVSVVVTYVATLVTNQLALTGTVSGGESVGDLAVTAKGFSSGMPSATVIHPVLGGGILISGANAGTATLFFYSETTAITTLKAGTMIRVMKMA
jgi:hypothetical protein